MKNKSSLDFLMQADTFSSPISARQSGTFDMAAEAAGLSEEQQRVRSVRKEAGVSYITLDSGRRIRFESVYVTAEDLSGNTQVHPFNLRTQEVVDEVLCEDILPSIKKAGVKLPVMATRDPDTGVFLIFDGSRRRFAALHCGQGLHIDVTDDALTDDEIAELSHITNLSKSSSLYDHGKYYQMQLEKLGLSLNKYSEATGIPKSSLSDAITAYTIPRQIFDLFPRKTELGRTFIKQIAGLIKSLDDEAVDALVTSCEHELAAATDQLAMVRLNELAGKSKPERNEAKFIGAIKIATKGKKITLDVPDEKVLDQIIKFLKKNFS